ncbi:MAG: mntB [Verrucomicrobiales bacterium]|nr:mntB [Verrucomicrobiales bacterium]
MSASIVLDKVTIGYDDHVVMSDISLTVRRGSFTAILGANGTGKSTLLKTIIGLQTPIAGRILFSTPTPKQEPADKNDFWFGGEFMTAQRRPLFGYVPQSNQFDALYLLSAFDVAMMGVYRRIGAGRIVPAAEKDLVCECMRATGADTFAKKMFSQLSGGQKQRVLIARALAAKPEILVLDEPTAGVDVAATHALLEFISQIHREQKLTVLLVTHDLPLVRKHTEQVVWLHEGKLLQGTASELLNPKRMAEILEMEIS